MTTITNMDGLRRVALPKEVGELEWTVDTPLEISVLENAVMIKPHKPVCGLCGRDTERIVDIEKGSICTTCLMSAMRKIRFDYNIKF